MAAKRNKKQRSRSQLKLRQVPGRDAWELVHPRCVRERREDMDEVQQMLDAGEFDVARDELVWLLSGCPDFVEAHRLLGEIALVDNDQQLARAHFGYAYQIGERAFPGGRLPGPLPYDRPANQAFLEAAKGLAVSAQALQKPKLAQRVARQLLQMDPADPLQMRPLLQAWERGDEPNEACGGA